MEISARVRFLNFFRIVFKIPVLESALSSATRGKSPNHFFSKLVPNPYQYPANSYRMIQLHGITMTVDISDYLGHCLYFGFEGEEWQSYQNLFGLVSDGDYILDVGSNIGYTLLGMAQIASTGKVVGFEPDNINYNRCLKNVNQNNFKNINLYNLGLGSAELSIPMEVRTEFNRGGNRVAIDGQGEIIHIKKLDVLFPLLGIPKIDVVKIDVEGYELHVLRGGEQVFRKFKPTLFIELNDDNIRDQGGSAKELMEFLIQIGYTTILQADTKKEVTIDFDFSDCHFDIIAK